jgi:hypothetical protein
MLERMSQIRQGNQSTNDKKMRPRSDAATDGDRWARDP